MPHSSGGGHSSSSFHSSSSSSHSSRSYSSNSSYSSSSSHSSSSYNSRPARRRQKEWFAGSRRYMYYDMRHRPKYVYCNEDLTKKKDKKLIGIIGYMLVLTLFSFMLYLAVTPHRLNTDQYNYKCEVYDYAGVIDDDNMLLRAMSRFSDTTGMPTTVVTVHNDDWEYNYYDLEEFAYYYYIANYSDEYHWVIVLSMHDYTDNSACDFIGMQGDNTDSVFPARKSRRFNKLLESNLQGNVRIDKAFADAFDTTEATVMTQNLKDNYGAFTLILIEAMWLYYGFKKYIAPRQYYEA